jgi:flavodoxin
MRAAVFYATREGQSQRVAERIAAGLRGHGIGAVRTFQARLTAMHASFLSLTLSQADAQDPAATPAQRRAAIDAFVGEDGRAA